MEEEVGDDRRPSARRRDRAAQSSTSAITGLACQPARGVGGDRRRLDDRLAIEQVEPDLGPAIAAMPCDLEHQPAVAAADLEDAQRADAGASVAAARSSARARMPARAHEGVDAAQVAARALRRRIVGREMVERLRLEDARQACRLRSSSLHLAAARRGS